MAAEPCDGSPTNGPAADAAEGMQPPVVPGRKPCPLVNGKRLKEYRKLCGMTQEQLAEKCEIGLSTIQRGEAGEGWGEESFKAVAEIFTALLNRPITPEELKEPQKLQK